MRIQIEPMTTAKPVAKGTRVLIVDDHPMTRAGLVHLINHQPDLGVCGEAENAGQALDAVKASKPDLVLADITLPGKSGLELIKDIKAMHSELPVLVVFDARRITLCRPCLARRRSRLHHETRGRREIDARHPPCLGRENLR